MNKKRVLVFVAVVLLGVGLYYFQTPSKPTSYLDSSLVSTYTILGDESAWRAKSIATDNPEAWNIPGKNVRVEIKNSQNNFYCGSKKATYKSYSNYSNPKYVGAWNSISVVDCGDFYLIYEYGDSGPELFGPFDITR